MGPGTSVIFTEDLCASSLNGWKHSRKQRHGAYAKFVDDSGHKWQWLPKNACAIDVEKSTPVPSPSAIPAERHRSLIASASSLRVFAVIAGKLNCRM